MLYVHIYADKSINGYIALVQLSVLCLDYQQFDKHFLWFNQKRYFGARYVRKS